MKITRPDSLARLSLLPLSGVMKFPGACKNFFFMDLWTLSLEETSVLAPACSQADVMEAVEVQSAWR